MENDEKGIETGIGIKNRKSSLSFHLKSEGDQFFLANHVTTEEWDEQNLDRDTKGSKDDTCENEARYNESSLHDCNNEMANTKEITNDWNENSFRYHHYQKKDAKQAKQNRKTIQSAVKDAIEHEKQLHAQEKENTEKALQNWAVATKKTTRLNSLDPKPLTTLDSSPTSNSDNVSVSPARSSIFTYFGYTKADVPSPTPISEEETSEVKTDSLDSTRLSSQESSEKKAVVLRRNWCRLAAGALTMVLMLGTLIAILLLGIHIGVSMSIYHNGVSMANHYIDVSMSNYHIGEYG